MKEAMSEWFRLALVKNYSTLEKKRYSFVFAP
jgi:hypothetical protein